MRFLISILLIANIYSQCQGDMNNDGIINVVDIVAQVSFILEGGECEDVNPYGCTDPNACNFDPNATIFDNSCDYITGNECDCDGNLFNHCGLCGDELCPFTVNNSYSHVAVNDIHFMTFSEGLDLSQFSIDYWLDDITFECEESPSGMCFSNADTTNIYKISSSLIFGVDCNLFYDSNFNALTGYNVTNENYPDGTGESCNPIYLNNIMSENGQFLSSELTTNSLDEEIGVVPNPYISSYESDVVNSIIFINLPEYWDHITIINPDFESSVDYILYTDGSSVFLELENSMNSGIYFWWLRGGDYDDIVGSFIILMPAEE